VAPRGRFIVFEGGEASGKSTQAKRLAGLLGAELTREPGGTPLGEELRRLLLEGSAPLDARTELLLMLAARAEHVVTKIAPALEHGVDVVCERFHGSTMAYQGYGRGLDLNDIEVACELAAPGLQADLVILLDLPLEMAHARLNRLPDRIEAEEASFHARVLEGYRELARADRARWVVIDASAPVDVVTSAITKAVRTRLGEDVFKGLVENSVVE
jgi:dTMP kinase